MCTCNSKNFISMHLSSSSIVSYAPKTFHYKKFLSSLYSHLKSPSVLFHLLEDVGLTAVLCVSLCSRDSKKSKGKKQYTKKEVIGIIGSGKTRTLSEFTDSRWSIVNSPWSIQLPSTNNDDGHLLELTGPKTVSVPFYRIKPPSRCGDSLFTALYV